MNSYLAGIVARGTPVEQSGLTPLLSPSFALPAEAPFPDGFEEWIGPAETGIGENTGSKEEGELEGRAMEGKAIEGNLNFSPVDPSPAAKAILHPATGPVMADNDRMVQYFSRHVERIGNREKVMEKPPVIPYHPPVPDGSSARQPTGMLFEQDPVQNAVEQGISHPKTSMLPQKTAPPGPKPGPAIHVSDEDIPEKTTPKKVPGTGNLPVRNYPPGRSIREIMPREPSIPSREEKNNPREPKSETAPKLVIGKITVEIALPPPTQPQKIITRVVQKSAEENHGNTNRLRFGLGQM
ncbi:MAG: hypothetical protein WCO44_05765 [Bacteroidota bacterium]